MAVQTGVTEDIDLSQEVDIGKKTEEAKEETTPEMNQDEQKFAAGDSSIKLRKKSMRRSISQDNLSGAHQSDEGEEMNEKKELAEEEEKRMTKAENEKPASLLHQAGLFLVVFIALVVVNKAIINVILYFLKPDGATDAHGKRLDVDAGKFDEEPEFSEFDRLMEH